jgi:hypothetical protein
VYEEGEWQQPRHLNHLALRAVNPESLAEFYTEVIELQALENQPMIPTIIERWQADVHDHAVGYFRFSRIRDRAAGTGSLGISRGERSSFAK